jgi:hypothetical protein
MKRPEVSAAILTPKRFPPKSGAGDLTKMLHVKHFGKIWAQNLTSLKSRATDLLWQFRARGRKAATAMPAAGSYLQGKIGRRRRGATAAVCRRCRIYPCQGSQIYMDALDISAPNPTRFEAWK